jgi:hypothetical protein
LAKNTNPRIQCKFIVIRICYCHLIIIWHFSSSANPSSELYAIQQFVTPHKWIIFLNKIYVNIPEIRMHLWLIHNGISCRKTPNLAPLNSSTGFHIKVWPKMDQNCGSFLSNGSLWSWHGYWIVEKNFLKFHFIWE